MKMITKKMELLLVMVFIIVGVSTKGYAAKSDSTTTAKKTTTQEKATTSKKTETTQEKATTSKKTETTQEKVTASTYTIYVNRTQNRVGIMNNKTKKWTKVMSCSTGTNYGTPKGTYTVGAKYRWHLFFHDWRAQWCTRLQGSNHILFHSVPSYEADPSTVSTAFYNRLGSQASSGCIRMAATDCKYIYDKMPKGTKIIVGESKSIPEPKRPNIRISTKTTRGWDPTDPTKGNPYYPKITLKKQYESKQIKQGSSFDVLKAVNYSAPTLTKLKLTAEGKVNTEKKGNYKVTYTCYDWRTTLKTTKTITYKVY